MVIELRIHLHLFFFVNAFIPKTRTMDYLRRTRTQCQCQWCSPICCQCWPVWRSRDIYWYLHIAPHAAGELSAGQLESVDSVDSVDIYWLDTGAYRRLLRSHAQSGPSSGAEKTRPRDQTRYSRVTRDSVMRTVDTWHVTVTRDTRGARTEDTAGWALSPLPCWRAACCRYSHCSTAVLQHVFTMGKLGAELMFALLVTSHITCVTLYTCVHYTTHDSWSWRHSDDQLAGRGVCVIAGAGLVLCSAPSVFTITEKDPSL